jgi:hypothetical protein
MPQALLVHVFILFLSLRSFLLMVELLLSDF